MSLDDFQLPPYLIKKLYQNVLIDTDSQPINEIKYQLKDFSFLGKNEKNILIIVNEAESSFLPDNDLQFLIKVMDACSLSLTDTALLNYEKNKHLNYSIIAEVFKPRIILLFGIGPEQLGFPLEFPKYQVQQYNQQTYLYAASLSTIKEDVPEKTTFWQCLKKIFIP